MESEGGICGSVWYEWTRYGSDTCVSAGVMTKQVQQLQADILENLPPSNIKTIRVATGPRSHIPCPKLLIRQSWIGTRNPFR